LAVYHKAPWRVEAYRTSFGLVFYGDREFFSGKDVFTLEPLLADGEYALVCNDIWGLDKVVPIQCKFQTGKGEIVAIHGNLVIQIVRGLKLSILTDGRIVSAKFKVKFTDSKAERMVTIKDGNLAEFKYDDDGRKIEEWLIKRGFKHEQRQ
jgi:hypothetical protein